MAALKGPAKWAYRAYQGLPAPLKGLGVRAQQRRAEAEVRGLAWWDSASEQRLWIGPLNTAGQASAWANAINSLASPLLPEGSGPQMEIESPSSTQAVSVAAMRRSAAPVTAYTVNVTLTQPMQLHGLGALRQIVLGPPGATHVLSESARPVLGDFFSASILDDVDALTEAGLMVGIVLHGSEIRDLHEHAARDSHSPFSGKWDERWTTMQETVERTREILAQWSGPVFVSTPDLLDDVPGATLLPVVADVAAMQSVPREAPLAAQVPVVLHAPSNPRLKGSDHIDQVLGEMEAAGLVKYERLVGVPHADMAARIASADIVVDQIVLGNPGVLLAESMAAGRLTLAHLSQQVRNRMQVGDPDGELPPVVEATPETLADALEYVLANREQAAAMAARGPAWATRNHDGTRAAAVLADFLSR